MKKIKKWSERTSFEKRELVEEFLSAILGASACYVTYWVGRRYELSREIRDIQELIKKMED